MSDLNNLIKELDSLISSITAGRSIKITDNKRIGVIGLDVSINVSPLISSENIQ